MYRQREIVLIPFPYSDLSGSKLRPALIVSNDILNKTDDRLCCLITSNPPKEGLLILKNSFDEGKLPFKSWVKPQRLFTIHKRIIKKRICTVRKEFYRKVLDEIFNFLRLD
jgi:mRNA interferase MazF